MRWMVWLAAVLLPAGGVVAGWLWLTSAHQGVPVPLAVSAAARAELEAAWEAELRAHAPSGPDWDELRGAWHARSRAELAVLVGQPRSRALMEATTRRCQALMADALSARGEVWYRAAGLRLAREAVAELGLGFAEARLAGGLHRWAGQLPAGSPERRAWQERWGSLALGVALRAGLADPAGELHPDADLHLTVVALYRWLQEAGQLKGLELSLQPSEEILLLRFKLERAGPVTGEARSAALQRLSELLPDYAPPASAGGPAASSGPPSG